MLLKSDLGRTSWQDFGTPLSTVKDGDGGELLSATFDVERCSPRRHTHLSPSRSDQGFTFGDKMVGHHL